jgi:hypothetical protein
VFDVEIEDKDDVYTDIAMYNDHEWSVKELFNAASNIIKGNSRRFKIEMNEVCRLECYAASTTLSKYQVFDGSDQTDFPSYSNPEFFKFFNE